MSLFKKVLVRAGIGGMKLSVDPGGEPWVAGSEASGIIRMQGGMTEQPLRTIEIELYAEYSVHRTDAQGKRRVTSARALIQSYTLPCEVNLQPNEGYELPLHLLIPQYTPSKLTKERIWLEAKIQLPRAVDPTARVRIEVSPDPLLGRILGAIDRLGYPLAQSYLTENSDDALSPDLYVQRIIYGASNRDSHDLEAMIITPVWQAEVLQVEFQFKQKQGLIKSVTGKDIVTSRIEWAPEEWSGKSDEELADYLLTVIGNR